MMKTTFAAFALAVSLLFVCGGQSNAQTVGYAETFDHFAVACGADIDKFCKKTDLGGGANAAMPRSEPSRGLSCLQDNH